MWFDLLQTTSTIPEAALSVSIRELDQIKGLDFLLIVHRWIWSYQRNAKQLADKFSIYKDYAKGKTLTVGMGCC
jgi:hypothetical protein